MHPQLTPGAHRALAAALTWSARLRATDVEPLHVLMGLLDEDEGRPALLLQQQGVAVAAARATLVGDRATVEAPAGTTDHDPFEHGLVRHLALAAKRLALDLTNEKTVSSEHLLLAILEQDPSLRATLSGFGFDVHRLRDQMQADASVPPLTLDEPLDLPEPADHLDAARILDANANRAREALRVLEDYCRFVLNDVFLSGECKQLRHGLADALADVPGALLAAARDTEHDVGAKLTTPSEGERASLHAVVVANAKRLQEALRSLEEYGKFRHPDLGKAIEALRYRTYTLDRALQLGAAARQRLAEVRLYLLLTGASCAASLEWTIEQAVAGGVQMVQLREKDLGDRDLLARAVRVRRAARKAGVPMIVNDRPDIARLADVDGVHLGQDDLAVQDARRILGADAIIGVSTHNKAQAEQAVRDGASYLGVGPTFPSGTKRFDNLAGLDYVRAVANLTAIPAFAIGGITPRNAEQVVAAGLRRVAISQAIAQADDPRAVAAQFRAILG
jgi:thiamine-phosphate pyrophosphorylase